jgi:hypothetical protein
MGRKGKIGNWPEPLGTVNCPSPEKLAEWIKNPGSAEAQGHLTECPTCADTVRSVREAAETSGGNLDVFMRSVRQRAQLESEQHSSRWMVLMNYLSASRAQTVGAVAAVATVALIATSGFWRQTGVQQAQPGQTIVLDRDVNGELASHAVTEIRTAYSAVSNGDISKTRAAAQINQLNETLGKIDKSKLQPQQKQELEAVQGEYQGLLFERLQPSLSSSPGGTKAQTAQKEFLNTYANILAKDGEQLTVSPEVSLKSSKTTTWVIGSADAPHGKRAAAGQAVQDLQSRVPDMVLEYKAAPSAAAEARPGAAASSN